MTGQEYRATLNWFMCSDPWPADASEQPIIEAMLDYEAKQFGFEDWLDAYHRYVVPDSASGAKE